LESAEPKGWWGTPTVQNARHAAFSPSEQERDPNVLHNQVHLAGWPTPTTRDWKDGSEQPNVPINSLLEREVWAAGPARLTATGELLTGSTAGMESGGQLNPAHSRWFMGLPSEWDDCGVTAMQSLRRQRKPSSRV
jgi:hypothetical protein